MSDQVMTSPDEAAVAQVMYDIGRGRLLDGPAPASFHTYDGQSLESGLALQLSVLRYWQATGETVGGYKIGWTSRDSRNKGGPGFRPFGYILSSRVIPSGAVLDRAEVAKPAVEPELCLTLGSRLRGEVSTDEARAAVASVCGGFEVLSKRLPAGSPMPCRIGNGLNNFGLVYGPEHEPPEDLSSIPIELFVNGASVEKSTSSLAVVDDPYLSLARVAAVLDRYGLALEPGQRVLTGSLTASVDVTGPVRFEATFGPFGSAVVEFR